MGNFFFVVQETDNKLTMSRKGILDEVITTFLLDTCRPRPLINKHALQAVMFCVQAATEYPLDDREAETIPLTTGSVAEFYIEPMLPHTGDVDVMYHYSIDLAIPRGHPPPTQLPAEFSDYVTVYEIIDSHLPGYVYLTLCCFLSYCTDDDKYNYYEYDNGVYLPNWLGLSVEGESGILHGPAVITDSSHTSQLSVDHVFCVRCLSWPPQAADWPTRHRNNGWPDSATVDRVVGNGCDVVAVAHRQCRQDEWMGKHQWRLSFSRAEIVLINSWMSVQQIVYHMLRVFVKTERLTVNGDNSEAIAVSNYHIKTLMLWTSETEPRSWWTGNLNLIRICAELLRTLSVCLTDARCPHYFINNCNLLNSYCSLEEIASQLMSIDETWLSTWFVNNYIRKCSKYCPDNVSYLFNDVSTTIKLQKAVSAVVDWRLNTALEDKWRLFHMAYLLIPAMISFLHDMTTQSCICWMTELSQMDTRLLIYFNAIAYLQFAYLVSRNGFSDELLDVLATISGLSEITGRHIDQHSSELSMIKATKLMKVLAIKSHCTVQLIEIELSKAYLHRAFRRKDSDSDSLYRLANVYLAVLYYTTGQYQTAIDHCTRVMRSQDHFLYNSHVVQGELLPKLDDDIDIVLGVAVFYQHIRRAALNQPAQHVAVFSTEIFAHYLYNRCLSIAQTSTNVDLRRYGKYVSNTYLLLTDVLALKSVFHKFRYRSIAVRNCRQEALATEPNTSELVELLQKSAIEHLTTYRMLEAQQFGSIATIVTTDFDALYAYKHGDYQRCLLLSTQNVHTLLDASCLTDMFTYLMFTGIQMLNTAKMAHVVTHAMFLQMFDDDFVSLTALTLIVNRECRYVPLNVRVTQLTLSLYLMTRCQLMLRHSVTSLVQTLDCIEAVRRRIQADHTLDHLTLKMTKRKILTYIT